jgi:ribosome-associated toxin RatA of RatAB toxin-antitoxin module
MIKAVINVPAARQQVFSVLTDYSGYRNWVPGCEACTVTSQSGNSADAQIVVSTMKRIEMSLHFEAQPVQSLAFRMTKGKELKAYSGTYRLMDATDGAGTVVIAELEIDAGMMVPRFMVDKMSKKMIDDTGVALRKHLAGARIPTAVAQAAQSAAKATARRRAHRLLRITKTDAGYKIWLRGEIYFVKTLSA